MTGRETRFVGSVPEHYDQGLGPHIFEGYADDLARRVAALAPSRVLELAAGTGIASRHLRTLLPDSTRLVVTDLNPPMLEVAKSKFGPDEAVTFQEADAAALPFEDASFDLVTCQFGVMFFPDKAQSYAETFRVLRAGGHYVLNSWGSWAGNPFAELAQRVTATFFPDDPPGFYRIPFGYHDPTVIAQSLTAAGFTDVSVEPVPLTSAIPDPELFARGLVFGNPLREEIETRGGDPEAVFAALVQALEAELGSQMPLLALVAMGRKPQP